MRIIKKLSKVHVFVKDVLHSSSADDPDDPHLIRGRLSKCRIPVEREATGTPFFCHCSFCSYDRSSGIVSKDEDNVALWLTVAFWAFDVGLWDSLRDFGRRVVFFCWVNFFTHRGVIV